jgi:hypothetical protein
MKYAAMVTFGDWSVQYGTWGTIGVHRILEKCREANVERVYWRVFEGGRASFASKVATVRDGTEAQSFTFPPWRRGFYDFFDHLKYTDFDPLAVAVPYAHHLGMEIYAWYTFNEDDHGHDQLPSHFSQEHPEFHKVDFQGRVYPGSLDFFFPEVRDYKLAILDELLAYDLDGIMFDILRHNGAFIFDPGGTYAFGYNDPIKQAYKEKTGAEPGPDKNSEPQWLDFRADPLTQFFQEARKRSKGMPLTVFLDACTDPKKDCLLDIPLLAAEETIDDWIFLMNPANYIHKYQSGIPEAEIDTALTIADARQTKQRLCPDSTSFNCGGLWVDEEKFRRYVHEAELDITIPARDLDRYLEYLRQWHDQGRVNQVNEFIPSETTLWETAKLWDEIGKLNQG